MTDEMYWKIRKIMTAEGAWNRAVNMKVYTTEEFVSEFGSEMSEELKALLRANVGRLQSYLDDRVLEPICPPPAKLYNEMQNVGRAKYLVNYHDGVKTHPDGSPFFDVAIFKNKKDKEKFIKNLLAQGYKYGSL